MKLPVVIVSVFKELAWSFFAKPVLMKAAFWCLEWAASKTDNDLDDRIVAEAKRRYESKDSDPLNSGT